MDRARARARTGARIRLRDESGHVRNISRRIASPSPSPDQLPEHSNNKSKAGHGARSFAAAARGGGTRCAPDRTAMVRTPILTRTRMRMTGYSGLISIGRGLNSRASNAARMEMVVVVGGDVGHGWLCLDLERSLVRGHGDDEPLLQPTLNRLFPMRVFRVFRLASLHDIRFHTVTTARSTSIVDGDCRHWDSESLLSGYYSPSPYDKYYVTDSALCCLTLQLSSHLLQCFRSL